MAMAFKLIEKDWHNVIREAARADRSSLRIVCPFIKTVAIRKLAEAVNPDRIEVITRFRLADIYEGVSDIGALRFLLMNDAKVRGVKNLHAKLYLFGESSALVTSANLTLAGMESNHELGFITSDPKLVRECRTYFDKLWARAGDDLVSERLDVWQEKVHREWANAGRSNNPKGLGDHGANAGLPDDDVIVPERVADAPQAFVKFFGHKSSRELRTQRVVDEVDSGTAHWACAYGKRPNQVQDGAVMFMGTLVRNPNDIIIFGRAIGMKHDPKRDVASDADIEEREWKERWSYYIRVHHPEFIRGRLADGIPLSTLKAKFGANSFASTKRNAQAGSGNTNPNLAYTSKPSVQLTPESYKWLNERLEQAFQKKGKLSNALLRKLGGPVMLDEEE